MWPVTINTRLRTNSEVLPKYQPRKLGLISNPVTAQVGHLLGFLYASARGPSGLPREEYCQKSPCFTAVCSLLRDFYLAGQTCQHPQAPSVCVPPPWVSKASLQTPFLLFALRPPNSLAQVFFHLQNEKNLMKGK